MKTPPARPHDGWCGKPKRPLPTAVARWRVAALRAAQRERRAEGVAPPVNLGWPRWSTPAIMAAGCVMVAVMFVGMGLSIVANVPGDWHLRDLHSHGPEGGGD